MNKLTNLLLGAILLIGLGGLIVSLQPGVQPNITVTPPEVTVTSPDVFPKITVSPADVNVAPVLGEQNEFYSGVSSTVVSISISNTATSTNKVVSANSGRKYLRLQNVGTYTASCQLTSATSTLAAGTGIVLYASSSANNTYEINPNNLYKGQINCIASTATTTITAVEK
jgi:hypothetical protein